MEKQQATKRNRNASRGRTTSTKHPKTKPKPNPNKVRRQEKQTRLETGPLRGRVAAVPVKGSTNVHVKKTKAFIREHLAKHKGSPKTQMMLMQTMLPFEVPQLHPFPDARDPTRDVSLAKTYQVFDRTTSAWTTFLNSQPPTYNPVLPSGNPVWYQIGTKYDYIVPTGDTRLLAIVPTIAQVNNTLATQNYYATTVFSNYVSCSQTVHTTVDTITGLEASISCSEVGMSTPPALLARLRRLESLLDTEYLGPTPNALVESYFYQIPDNTWIGFGDLYPGGTAVPEPYGAQHPPVMFEFEGSVVHCLWVDACPASTSNADLNYTVMIPEAMNPPGAGTGVSVSNFTYAIELADNQAPMRLIAYRVGPAEESGAPTLVETASSNPTFNTVIVTPGTYTQSFTASVNFRYSGYYAFKLEGTVTYGVQQISRASNIGIKFDQLEYRSATSLVSRHVLNHQIISTVVNSNESSDTSKPFLQSSMVTGSSLLYTNVTPVIAQGGYIECIRQTDGNLWFGRSSLETWTTENNGNPNTMHDYKTLPEPQGVYSVIKQNRASYTRPLTISFGVPGTYGSVDTILCSYLTGKTSDVGYALNTNVIRISIVDYANASQTFRALLTTTFQFTTKSQLFALRMKPTAHEKAYLEAVLCMPTFTENPFHFATFLRNIFSKAREGVHTVAKVVREVAPTVGAIGSALSMVPDPRVAAVGNALGEGANIADYIAGRV